MRAEEKHGELLRTRAAAENVAREIDVHLKASFAHQPNYVSAPSKVGFRESDATDAALGILPIFAELLERGPQAILIYVPACRVGLLISMACPRTRGQSSKQT